MATTRARSVPRASPPLLTKSLDVIHRVQTTLLEPHHSEVIHQHLDNIHSSGRRSRTLDVGTVSLWEGQVKLTAGYG